MPNDELYSVRRILDSKKEKGSTQYLVDWAPSYVNASFLPKEVIEEYKLYKNGVNIIGPYEPSTKGKNNRNWKWVVQFGDEYKTLPHDEVVSKFKDELIKYFMNQATVVSNTTKESNHNNNEDDSDND